MLRGTLSLLILITLPVQARDFSAYMIETQDRKAVDERTNAEFASGNLRPPSGFAMTYMMSPEQWLGEDAGHWRPHLMFWLPYIENDETGGNPALGELPFVTSGSESRAAVLVVAVKPLDATADAAKN